MPDGRTHDEITLVTAAFLAPICLVNVFGGDVGRTVVFLGSHIVSGLLFSDDLDIDSIEYRRWGFLRYLWLPYQKLLPHRSRLSHGLIIGPALRILYFAAVLTLALWLLLLLLSRVLPLDAGDALGRILSAFGRFLASEPDLAIVAFAGFVMGSAVHSLSDALWTWWRRAIRGPVFVGQAAALTAHMPTHHHTPVPDYAQPVSTSFAPTGPTDQQQ